MASPTKISWNKRNARDAKLLKRRQLKLRKEQAAKDVKLKKLLS